MDLGHRVANSGEQIVSKSFCWLFFQRLHWATVQCFSTEAEQEVYSLPTIVCFGSIWEYMEASFGGFCWTRWFVGHSAEEMCVFIGGDLCYLFNFTLQHGCIPAIWKKCFVRPIYKSGERNYIQSYRGVSVQSITSKLQFNVWLLKFFL